MDEYSDRTKEEDEDVLLSAAIEGMFLNSELFDHQRGASNKGYKKIDMGTLVLSTQNLHLGNANVNLRFNHGMVSPAYKTYHIHDCSIELIAEWVKSEKAKRFFYDATTVGASVCRRNVEWDTLYDQPLYLPSEAEQERLATFLTTLSARIKKQTELVEHLKKYKRGAIEAIFNRTISFSSDTQDSWKEFRLGEFARRITRKNGQTTDIPLTISAQHGLIDQREFFSKTVASSDMSGYYLLHKGEFAYNRSTSSEYPYGSIKRLDKYDKGAVSTLYLCFEANEKIMESDFIMWYFESSRWHNGVREICAEGARNHGLLNVPTAGFFDTVHYLPSNKAEQKQIAAFLSSLDERYTRAFSELEELNKLKRGLYQSLFI